MNIIMYDFEILRFYESYRHRSYLEVKETNSNKFYHIFFEELIFLLQNAIIKDSKFSHACYAKAVNGIEKLIPIGCKLDTELNIVYTKISKPISGQFYITKNDKDNIVYLGKHKDYHFTFKIIDSFNINDYQLKANLFQSKILDTKSKQEFFSVLNEFYAFSYYFSKTKTIPTLYKSSVIDTLNTNQIDTLLFVYDDIMKTQILSNWDWKNNLKIFSNSTNPYVITIYNHWITLK